MVYFDSAATSLLKPKSVALAMTKAMNTMASPGRGGHLPAMRAAETVYTCREAVANLFHMNHPEQVVFTFNATHGLNIAIRSLVCPGCRVVISGYEHNSVTRPLQAIGAEVHVAKGPVFDQAALLEEFTRLIPNCDLVICTHVSNVFGHVLPIGEIADICKKYGKKLVIDASQSAGILDLNVSSLGAQFVAMPGHKGLLGPQGTGVLLCKDDSAIPYLYGGTGSNSISSAMPPFLPDKLEAGTHNIPGIAGLLAGIQYIQSQGLNKISAHETNLKNLMVKRLEQIPGLQVFSGKKQSGVLSVIPQNRECEWLAEMLGKRGIAVRGGLHCAPLAHKTAGTLDTGTVRFSFSPFNTQREVIYATEVLQNLLKNNH
jgi:cysteine desulfurase family protein